MHRIAFFFCFSACSLLNGGEFRTWSNPDKTKTFEGEFVSQKDHLVTFRNKNFKQFTVAIDKLHKDDQLWISQNRAQTAYTTTGKPLKQVSEQAIFDTLVFGDSRDTVIKKLSESKIVTSSVATTHIGRTGLNNIYKTREKIGGLGCSLTFNWSETGELIELTLQTENKNLDDYTTSLKTCWQEFSELLSSIHGNPKRAGEMPKPSEIENDQMLASHLWRLEQGGSILLGSSKMDGSYQVVVRFTKERFD
jgi:hypothetical protein